VKIFGFGPHRRTRVISKKFINDEESTVLKLLTNGLCVLLNGVGNTIKTSIDLYWIRARVGGTQRWSWGP